MFTKLSRKMASLFGRLRGAKKGAAMAEYAILVAGVALVSLVAVSMLGHKINDMFSAVATILPGAHADDNGGLISGHLVEMTQDANKNVILDVPTIVSNR